MEIDKLINKPYIKKKLPHLHYISFIKFISMITIIKRHISIWKEKPIDYGARMCEFLFISSGFLVGYNYFLNPMKSDYWQSFSYYYKHLKAFYPFYLINTLIDIHIHRDISLNILTNIEILIINIVMLQSFSRYKELVPCFNGHTWFLSALLFSYFLTPFLLNGIKNLKRSLVLFLIISSIRILGEELMIKGAINLFDANFHYGPIVRMMEFYMGMLTIPIYFLIRFYLDKYQNNKIYFKTFFSFIQISLPILIYIFMYKFNYIIPRCYFTLIFSLFIIFIGFDYGYLSNIFSSLFFQIVMNCQMEMYLLQLNVNYYINLLITKKHPTNRLSIELEFAFKLIIIFIIGFSYKKMVKKKLTNILDKIVLSLINII